MSPSRVPFKTPLWHHFAEWLMRAAAFSAIAAVLLIFAFVAREGIPLLWEHFAGQPFDVGSLFAPKKWPGYDEAVFVWQPVGGVAKYNVLPLFVGSIKVTLLAMMISVPVGLASAVYVSQYSPKRVREFVKPAIELLAGIPSVVIGFFMLMVVATWVQDLLGLTHRLNALVAAIGLAVVIIPVIFTVSEDALQAVPRHLSEAALALGARKYQTVLRVILPAALPGIAAAIMLGFGRAMGETLIVLMVSGNAATMNFDPTSGVRTITATIASELGEVARGDEHWRVLFLLGTMLFLTTFVLNTLSAWTVSVLRRKLGGQGASGRA